MTIIAAAAQGLTRKRNNQPAASLKAALAADREVWLSASCG